MEAGVQEGWGMGYKAGGHQCTSLQCPLLPFQGHEGQRSLETVGHNGSFCVFTKEYRMVSTTCFSRWKIPRMEEPGRLQSMESLRVGYD